MTKANYYKYGTCLFKNAAADHDDIMITQVDGYIGDDGIIKKSSARVMEAGSSAIKWVKLERTNMFLCSQ